MSTTTTRNALVKPDYTDAADIAVLNTSLDTIDAAIAKCNYAATAAPTANDDSGDGYSIGSVWIDTTNHYVYVAESVTLTAAVWRTVYPQTQSGVLLANGTVPLTANWDVGAYKVTANQLESDVASGTAPLVVASTTKVSNLNVDQLDGLDDTAFVKQTLADAKGDLIVASAADTWAREAVSTTDGDTLTADASATNGVSWQPAYAGRGRNLLFNPEFSVNQEQITTYTSITSPANSDDTYLFDQWTLLSDGNDIVDVWQSTAGPTGNPGCPHSIMLQTETANKKFGIIQFLDTSTCRGVINGTVSLSFFARTLTSYENSNLMAAVISWSSTGDAVTSDVVSSWEATNTAPTLAANWTYENVPSRLALSATEWTRYKIENISIDTANTVNIAVFIWMDDTNSSVDDRVYITGVQLNAGPTALPYSAPSYQQQLLECKKYFMIWNPDAGAYGHVGTCTANDTEYGYIEWPHTTNWRASSPAIALTGTLTLFDAVASESLLGTIVIRVQDVAKGLTAGHSYVVYASNDTSMRIRMHSRL